MSAHRAQTTLNIGLPLIILLALLTALDAMAIDMYLPGMPSMAEDFGVPAAQIQLTLYVFLAGLAIGQAIYGPLLDRFGRRAPLLIGVAIFVAGSVVGALAQTVEWLLAARFIQAIGAAAGLVAPRAIVADTCDLKQSSYLFSLLMQVMMIAPIVAPLLGGYLLNHGGWRVIFCMLGALGALGLLWSLKAIPDSLPLARRSPLRPGHVARAYARQFRNPVFMAWSLSGDFALSALFVYISGSSFVFMEFFGLTPAQFSYLFAANSVALVLGGMLGNRLLKRGQSSERVMVIGIVIHTTAGLGLFMAIQAGLVSLSLYAILVAVAMGSLGLVLGNVTALTMDNAGEQAGTAAALMGMLHYLTAALVGLIVSLTALGPGQLPLAIGFCGALALVMYRFAVRTRLAQQPEAV